MGKQWKQWQTIFLGSKITTDGDCSHEIKRHLLFGRKAMTNLDSILESRDIPLLTKVHLVKAMDFSCNCVWIWELDYKERWALKNWCVVGDDSWKSTLDCKEIHLVNLKGNRYWIFIGRTDAEAETPILWPHDVNCFIGKDLDAGKDWRQKDKGMPGDEMVGWSASLTQWTWVWASSRSWWLKGSLVCCSPWGFKERYMTEWLNWTEMDYAVLHCFSRVWLCDPIDCSLPGSSVHGDSPGKNSGVGHYALLQGIFPTQWSNPGLLHCRQIPHQLSHQGSPTIK